MALQVVLSRIYVPSTLEVAGHRIRSCLMVEIKFE